MDSRLGSDERNLFGVQPLITAALAPWSRADYH